MVDNIKTIDDQIRILVDNIKKLQDEIKTYQSGYKAFETASAAIESLAKAQSGLTGSIAESLKELEAIDTVTIIKKIDVTADKLAMAVSAIEALSQKLNYGEEITELKKQNAQILKQLNSINARLSEGVEVKKKKWFA
jgi:hypothetical protein